MRVLALDDKPFHEVPYLNIASGGRGVLGASLPILRGTTDRLPDDLRAIVLTADLQGRETLGASRPGRLLGERLADELGALSERGVLPPLQSVGVILAGDFFADPRMARRGGAGDVRSVWRAFASRCRWVAGVAGNHDVFGSLHSGPELDSFRAEAGIHLLDGNWIELDGLRVAGLSGIIGNPKRPWRRPEAVFSDLVLDLLASEPDVLILHDGPDVPGQGLVGWPCIREALEVGGARLVVRGHSVWETPLASLDPAIQVLNVDSRVVVLGPQSYRDTPRLSVTSP